MTVFPKRWASIGAALLATAALAGCAKPTQYDWGNYAHDLYGHYSGDENDEVLASQLQDIIAKGEPTGNVPPGVYAEYGYLLMVSGKTADAVSYFGKEKLRYPESTVLMDRMIKMAKSGTFNPAKPPKKHPEEKNNAPGV